MTFSKPFQNDAQDYIQPAAVQPLSLRHLLPRLGTAPLPSLSGIGHSFGKENSKVTDTKELSRVKELRSYVTLKTPKSS